jgi:LysR family hydrogen peroxide-inducible transcriptional activator
MDVREYKYILTVIKCGTISGAAKILNISQPSLSAYVKNLENKAGIKFFHKVEGVLHLTSEGSLYLEYARKIVDLDESLSIELRNIQNLDSGEVKMGITATRGTFYLHLILPVLKKRYPGITIKLTESNSSEQLEGLVYNREIDFAIMSYPFMAYDLEYEIISREDIVITVPSGDPVCKSAVKKPGRELPWVDLRRFKDHAFILLNKGQRLRQAADKLFAQAGYEPKILFETRNSITAYNLSAAGMGPSITTSGFGRLYSGSTASYFTVGASPLIYEMVMAYHSKSSLSNSARAIINEVKPLISNIIPIQKHR